MIGGEGDKLKNQSKRYINESDDCCTLGSDSISQSLISYQNQISPPSPPISRQIPTHLNKESKIKRNNNQMTLQIENFQGSNQPSSIMEDNHNNYSSYLNQKSSAIKSTWIETTTSGKSCFLTGRGSNYGTQSHIQVHSAMDQVILKHHKAA